MGDDRANASASRRLAQETGDCGGNVSSPAVADATYVFHNGWHGYKSWGIGLACYATFYETPRTEEKLRVLEQAYRIRAAQGRLFRQTPPDHPGSPSAARFARP
jgi:hypothetical protein